MAPMNRSKYPPDWEEIRQRILNRAGQILDEKYIGGVKQEATCEMCGKVQNHSIGYWDEKEGFNLIDCSYQGDADAIEAEEDGYNIIKIVLTIMHLDHDEENWNVKDERLMAGCQRCHLRYDAPEKARRRLKKRESNMLFPLNDQGLK